ncbi:MHO_1580 family protein [Mycoplasma struthionis]|uniref:Uncharacterized protein n=1 Tax=Mycoplasma struthionis TaxID=538220 RepID=A0A3G8LIV6_9MOLU|nr:hypothetical protein [Mycoplasma struthionis]AZG68810.1 hypothetical protein EGN60_02500 [Mycoplasma struthionis]TPI01584.1 hypothetical protein FJM01_02390 [Mycoplasma struthionis]
MLTNDPQVVNVVKEEQVFKDDFDAQLEPVEYILHRGGVATTRDIERKSTDNAILDKYPVKIKITRDFINDDAIIELTFHDLLLENRTRHEILINEKQLDMNIRRRSSNGESTYFITRYIDGTKISFSELEVFKMTAFTSIRNYTNYLVGFELFFNHTSNKPSQKFDLINNNIKFSYVRSVEFNITRRSFEEILSESNVSFKKEVIETELNMNEPNLGQGYRHIATSTHQIKSTRDEEPKFYLTNVPENLFDSINIENSFKYKSYYITSEKIRLSNDKFKINYYINERHTYNKKTKEFDKVYDGSQGLYLPLNFKGEFSFNFSVKQNIFKNMDNLRLTKIINQPFFNKEEGKIRLRMSYESYSEQESNKFFKVWKPAVVVNNN